MLSLGETRTTHAHPPVSIAAGCRGIYFSSSRRISEAAYATILPGLYLRNISTARIVRILQLALPFLFRARYYSLFIATSSLLSYTLAYICCVTCARNARTETALVAHLLSFQLLAGTKYTAGWVPTELKRATFQALHAHCAVLKDYYEHNGQSYILKTSR